MRDLLLLLIGALFTLGVHASLQLVIVPRVEARKRREDRWERDVLTLGELLSHEVTERARNADHATAALVHFEGLRGDPTLDAEKLTKVIKKQRTDAVEAMRAFEAVARTRVDWLVKSVTRIAPDSPQLLAFQNASRLYTLRVLGTTFLTWSETDRSETEQSAAWTQERDARGKLIEAIEDLADAAVPPRRQWRVAVLLRRVPFLIRRTVHRPIYALWLRLTREGRQMRRDLEAHARIAAATADPSEPPDPRRPRR